MKKKKSKKKSDPDPALKRYVIKKYIMAKSANQALRLEHKYKADDCFIDEDWRKDNNAKLVSTIGFKLK